MKTQPHVDKTKRAGTTQSRKPELLAKIVSPLSQQETLTWASQRFHQFSIFSQTSSSPWIRKERPRDTSWFQSTEQRLGAPQPIRHKHTDQGENARLLCTGGQCILKPVKGILSAKMNLWKHQVLNGLLLPSAGHNIDKHFNYTLKQSCNKHNVLNCNYVLSWRYSVS